MDTLYFCMVRNYNNRIINLNYLVKTWSQRKIYAMDTLWTLYGQSVPNYGHNGHN